MQDVLTFLDLEMEYSGSDEEIALLQRARNEFMDLLSITFGRVLDGPPCPLSRLPAEKVPVNFAGVGGFGEGDLRQKEHR